MDVMADGAPISMFPKWVKEPSRNSSNIQFTNGLAVQVAIPDSKKAAEYTDTLTKDMDYFNGNDSHPIYSSRVFLPVGKAAVIDKGTFQKSIQM
jgi:hypothetical protein